MALFLYMKCTNVGLHDVIVILYAYTYITSSFYCRPISLFQYYCCIIYFVFIYISVILLLKIIFILIINLVQQA